MQNFHGMRNPDIECATVSVSLMQVLQEVRNPDIECATASVSFMHVSTRFEKEFSEANSMQESKSKDELFNSNTVDEIFNSSTIDEILTRDIRVICISR